MAATSSLRGSAPRATGASARTASVAADTPRLTLDRSIGFDGATPQSLVHHPDGQHILYALGSTVVVREIGSRGQEFMTHNQQDVSCVQVSSSGRYVATGHSTFMGFKADVCVWDFERRALLFPPLVLHKCRVIDLSFSPNERFLVSLGGEDDNSLVVWDLESGTAICGSPASKASSGMTSCVEFFSGSDTTFVSGGNNTLRVWNLDLNIRKILPTDCNLGKQKRIITCMRVEADDSSLYAGTSSGDVLFVNLRTLLFQHSGPTALLEAGITAIALVGDRAVVVGTGTGLVATLRRDNLKKGRQVQLAGAITTIATTNSGNGDIFFVGTAASNIYSVSYASLEAELKATAHPTVVNDVAFPRDYSEVFATCGPNDIRLWNSGTSEELLRIDVPNVTCLCVVFSADGGTILSGWDDGRIRAFAPQSGRQVFVIENAHKKGVTALAPTADGSSLVSGGGDGEVRIWRTGRASQSLEHAMKEHKNMVTSIHLRRNELECVTSSADGSCIIWDLQRHIRVQVLFAPSIFKQARYHPEETQILTCGSDRKISFWDAVDGSAIRELDMPPECAGNSVDVFADGEHFVSGGEDRLVHLWNYDAGEITHEGVGHSATVVKVVVAPNQRELVSISSDGAIFIWNVPTSVSL